jgi:general secretion pathway protein G
MFIRGKKRAGFTLVEIMIVLAILGSIFALLARRIVGAQDKARQREAKIMLGQIVEALQMFNSDCGKYPEKLDYLVQKDPGCGNWGPDAYIKTKKIKDPWNNEFHYELSNGDYTLKSYGKDGREGGTAFNRDIDANDDGSGGEGEQQQTSN